MAWLSYASFCFEHYYALEGRSWHPISTTVPQVFGIPRFIIPRRFKSSHFVSGQSVYFVSSFYSRCKSCKRLERHGSSMETQVLIGIVAGPIQPGKAVSVVPTEPSHPSRTTARAVHEDRVENRCPHIIKAHSFGQYPRLGEEARVPYL